MMVLSSPLLGAYSVGIVVVKGAVCELLDMNTKSLGKSTTYSEKALQELVEEAELTISGKMVVIDHPISSEEFVSGRLFLNVESGGLPIRCLNNLCRVRSCV